MEKTLIQLKDICKVYNPGENEVRALDHINLEIMGLFFDGPAAFSRYGDRHPDLYADLLLPAHHR